MQRAVERGTCDIAVESAALTEGLGDVEILLIGREITI